MSTIIESVSANELKNLISEAVRKELENLHPPQAKDPEFLNRKQVADVLGISLVTLNDWTKRGLIPALKIGTRIRYKKAEVFEALKQVETLKYRRAK